MRIPFSILPSGPLSRTKQPTTQLTKQQPNRLITFSSACGFNLAKLQLGRGREHHRRLRPVSGLEGLGEDPRALHGVEVALPGLEPVRREESRGTRRRRTLPEGDPYGLSFHDEFARHGSLKPENCSIWYYRLVLMLTFLLFFLFSLFLPVGTDGWLISSWIRFDALRGLWMTAILEGVMQTPTAFASVGTDPAVEQMSVKISSHSTQARAHTDTHTGGGGNATSHKVLTRSES